MPLAPAKQPIVFSKKPYKKPKFPNLYYGKTNIKYYNFS